MFQKLTLLVTPWLIVGASTMSAQSESLPIKGITVVAPPTPIGDPEMLALKDVNTKWIALVPYGFARPGQPSIRYNLDRQWWGEKQEGIEACIKSAHTNGLKVMLKPQVYIHGHWVGDVTFDTDLEWQVWERSYREFIEFYEEIAIRLGVEMFCVGTEYKKAAQERPLFWKELITDLRSRYDGQIIYSSNWDGYEKVPFWDDLDYVGISSYFPLTDRRTPTKNQLTALWSPIKKRLRKFYRKHKKKIIFTEYGYMSIDGCAGKAWEIEKDRDNRSINETAQANAYDALLGANWKESYWAGGFLWKWFPAGMGHEGYPEKDYTPQGKKAAAVISNWYEQQ